MMNSESPCILGDIRELAMRRFLSLERRLTSQVIMYESYREFIREYLELGHMELVSEVEKCPANVYYLPHHPVIKESSMTTKLRVIFDTSEKTTTGVSENDIRIVGQRIQQELFPFLLRFRILPAVVCADIEKMFRRVIVNRNYRDFQ